MLVKIALATHKKHTNQVILCGFDGSTHYRIKVTKTSAHIGTSLGYLDSIVC